MTKVTLIRGDGIGPEPWKNAGFGLRYMWYRADLIGARLELGTGEGGGTVVRCVVPYSRAR